MFILRKFFLLQFVAVIMLMGYKPKEKQAAFCTPCNVKEVSKTEKKIATINERQVKKFLCTLKKECQNNVEFAEFSNKVLFDLLNKKTDVLIKTLSQNNGFDMEYILSEISSPLLDYNFKDLLTKIEKSEESPEVKKQLIEALKKAEG